MLPLVDAVEVTKKNVKPFLAMTELLTYQSQRKVFRVSYHKTFSSRSSKDRSTITDDGKEPIWELTLLVSIADHSKCSTSGQIYVVK